MIFSDFLSTPLQEQFPKAKVKSDLIHFKQLFKYADKSDTLYGNLIDNIFWLLERKFKRCQLLYTNLDVMYNEMLMIISSQIPQFMFIQKKQLLESLDTFSELQNWGSVTKDNLKRTIIGDDNDTSSTGFVPIDVSRTDPYSKNTVNKQSSTTEDTNVARNTTDFLEFFKKMRWNVASIDLDKILKPYFSLFVMLSAPVSVEFDGGSGGGGGGGDVPSTIVSQLRHEIELVDKKTIANRDNIQTINSKLVQEGERIGANTTKIETNRENIETLSSNVRGVEVSLTTKLSREQADELFLTPSEGDSRYIRHGSTDAFITRSEVSRDYITKSDADSKFATRGSLNNYTLNTTTTTIRSDLDATRNTVNKLEKKINYKRIDIRWSSWKKYPGSAGWYVDLTKYSSGTFIYNIIEFFPILEVDSSSTPTRPSLLISQLNPQIVTRWDGSVTRTELALPTLSHSADYLEMSKFVVRIIYSSSSI